MTNLGDRIIVLIDMDCFFCQVESRLQPSLQGKPVAVVQYNQWKLGGIIAVNYEARDYGVTRHMRGNEAKEKCPNIELVSVPSVRGKADTSKYRAAGREVIDVLKKHCSIIERASVDEAYLDITELVDKRISSGFQPQENIIKSLINTYVVGYCNDESNDEEQRRTGVEQWVTEAYGELGDEHTRKLAIAGSIVEELRAEIYAISKFRCSAGISHNKILAKLACGIHKPNRQTILPTRAVPSLYSRLPVKKVRNLGGKFGNIVMESLGCNVMADLMRYTLQNLQERFDEKTGTWLYNIARGIDKEPVVTRLVCKSIGASKNFPGKQAIVKFDVLKHWTSELALDVSDRLEQDLEENERRATTLTISFQYYENQKVVSQSHSCPLKSYKAERIATQCLEFITKSAQKPIANIGIAAGKFVAAKGSGNFINFFKTSGPSSKSENLNIGVPFDEDINSNTNKESLKPDDDKEIIISQRNSEDLNSDLKAEVQISGKPKTSVESFFIKRAKNYQESTESMESILPETIIESNNSNDSNENRQKELETSKMPPTSISSFFNKRTQNPKGDTKSDEPISPSTSILGSKELKKALNHENLKNSFFMNFLREAQPEVKNEVSESPTLEYEERQKTPEHVTKPVDSPTQETYSSNGREQADSDLLVQLREIFPDFNNIDRSVVQLLPIELQRLANSYLKPSMHQNVQPVKKVPKTTKSKTEKSKGTPSKNSLQNFFVKTIPNTRDDPNFRKCEKCNQMIRVEKYFEHNDFHVAQNLQREMNRNNSSGNDRTASLNSSKRRHSDENSTPNTKRPKSISSFFCP